MNLVRDFVHYDSELHKTYHDVSKFANTSVGGVIFYYNIKLYSNRKRGITQTLHLIRMKSWQRKMNYRKTRNIRI